jgi:signal transduction histidine kinase
VRAAGLNAVPFTLLTYVVALADPIGRAASAEALGHFLGGETTLVFVRDREVDMLLPAPGLVQTLPNGRAWRRFLERCASDGEGVAELPVPWDGASRRVIGVACGLDVVAVLVAREPLALDLRALRELLPFLAAIVRGEREAASAGAQAALARQAAAHAESMARALDATRGQLQRALHEADGARRALEEANDRLSAQACELETANLQMQEQAVELEAQAAERELQADELQLANVALETARIIAEAGNRAKSEFLATMSHELRTPLNAIAGHVQLVQLGIHGPVTAAQREALERVDRSQRHLLGLINDILNLARIESGRVEYRLREISMAETMRDLLPMIEPQVASKGLRLVSDVDPGLCARADSEKLQQVLLNLLSNAVKFTPVGGTISIAADRTEDGRRAVVRVRDTGIGIPVDRLDDIFEPFVQVDASHSRTEEGTGLGLSISRDLARGMGGDLTVESTPGTGSTFTLVLPHV